MTAEAVLLKIEPLLLFLSHDDPTQSSFKGTAMDRKLFFTLLVFSFTLFLLYQAYSIISPFLAPLVLAGVIAITTGPLYKRLLRKVPWENSAAFLMTAAVILVCVAPLVGLTFLLSQEAALVYKRLEESASASASAGGPGFFDAVTSHPRIAPWLQRFAPFLGQFEVDIPGATVATVRRIISSIVNYSGDIAKNIFGFIFKLIMLIIALFFAYRDGDRVQRQFWSVVPLDGAKKQLMVETITRVLSAIIYGVFLACLVQGTLGGIGFWIAGLPAPLLFGAAMSVCALIPVVGTALIWGPGAVYLLLQGRPLTGLFLLVWGAVAISSIDNIIRPIFISGKARLSVLVIALGILGGIVSFGFAGIVIGPIVLALFLALFDIYRAEVFPGGEAGRASGPDTLPDGS